MLKWIVDSRIQENKIRWLADLEDWKAERLAVEEYESFAAHDAWLAIDPTTDLVGPKEEKKNKEQLADKWRRARVQMQNEKNDGILQQLLNPLI